MARSGLSETDIRSSFEYLVESGSVYSKSTSDGKKSFFIFNTENLGNETNSEEVGDSRKESSGFLDLVDVIATIPG